MPQHRYCWTLWNYNKNEGSVIRGGYTFFWKVRAKIKSDQVITRTYRTSDQVIKASFLTAFNERPMSSASNWMPPGVLIAWVHMTPPPKKNWPTVMKRRKSFYEDLNNIVKAVSTGDTIILMGDFNVRYGSWKGVLRQHGTGNSNSNGLFRHAHKYKSTWMNPRSKQCYLLETSGLPRSYEDQNTGPTTVVSG